MLKLLVESLQPDSTHFLTTHFSRRLVSYDQDEDGVTLHFTDGSSERADILVGADGLASSTRKKMYKDISERVAKTDPGKAQTLLGYIPPTWTGTYAYRALLDREKLREKSPKNIALDAGYMVRATYRYWITMAKGL